MVGEVGVAEAVGVFAELSDLVLGEGLANNQTGDENE